VARLFYVIGASGAGKDTLLRYARVRVGGSGGVVFAHRYITRPAAAGRVM
jgi:ribose 1,5-bisphosphokinase